MLDIIEKEGSKIALVLFGGLSYYTGQWFPMKSVTKAAKAKVHSSCSEGHDVQAYDILPGMHLWMGLGPRSRQRADVLTRLGRRLRCLVHIQVLELRTRRDRWIVYPREVDRNRNTKVSVVDLPLPFSLIPVNQIRWLVGTNCGDPISDEPRVLSDSRCPRIPAVEPSGLDRRLTAGIATDLQESRVDGSAPRTI